MFYTQKVFTPQFSSTWPTKRRTRWWMLSPAGVSRPRAWANINKTELSTLCHLPFRPLGSPVVSRTQLSSAPLRSAGLGLSWARSLCTPQCPGCSPHQRRGTRGLPRAQLSWALGVLFFPRDRKEWEQWEHNKIYGVGPANIPEREMEQNGAVSRVCSLFNSPRSHAPAMKFLV